MCVDLSLIVIIGPIGQNGAGVRWPVIRGLVAPGALGCAVLQPAIVAVALDGIVRYGCGMETIARRRKDCPEKGSARRGGHLDGLRQVGSDLAGGMPK